MANLSKICEELFWVLFEEQFSNVGVLQVPGPVAVWHSVGLGAMSPSPATIWDCDSDLGAPTCGSSAKQ